MKLYTNPVSALSCIMDTELIRDSIEHASTLGFVRSSGPGGQNVNKVSTAVVLHMALADIQGISLAERELLRTRLANRINSQDQLVVQVQDSRSQWHNRQLAVERTLSLIVHGLHRDKPRRPTKPSRASQERRMASKHAASTHKQNRTRPGLD